VLGSREPSEADVAALRKGKLEAVQKAIQPLRSALE